MARLPILTAPNKLLKRQALPVLIVDDSIRHLMMDMADTMYHAQGIGLAAPQVGVRQRIIVIDVHYCQQDGNKNPIFMANPEIIHQEGEIIWNEGCLSVPDLTSEVTRAANIQVKGLNQHGETVLIQANDILAVCFQHEIDHLNGILFIDHISSLKRSIIMQKLKKKKQDKE